MNRLSKSIQIVLWAAAIAAIIKLLLNPVFDPDLWWHLAAGREMARLHHVLRTDVFSFSHRGLPWVNFEWLSQILIYLVFKVAGIKGIYLAKIFFSMTSIGALAWACWETGARGWVLFFLTTLGFLMLQPRYMERAELITLNMLPVFVALLLRMGRDPRRAAAKMPWVFGALIVLWCNLHAGFVYGIGIVALLLLGGRWAGRSEDWIRLMDRIFVFLLIGMLINPFGPRLAEIFVEHLVQIIWNPPLINEWHPATVREFPFFWFSFLLCTAGLVWGVLRGPEELRMWILVVLVFAVWGSVSKRTTSLFAFMGLPFLGAISARRPLADWKPVWRNALAAAGFLLPLFLVGQKAWSLPVPRAVIQQGLLPSGACQFIEKNKVKGTMYNSYHFGGFIEWTLGSGYPVFMDGRYLFQPLLLEQDQLNRELLIAPLRSRWGAYLDQWGIDYAITDYGLFFISRERARSPFDFSPLNIMFPRSHWALVFWDDAALVFIKRTPANQELIQRFEYHSIWPYNIQQTFYFMKSGAVAPDAVAAELDRHEKEAGLSYLRQTLRGIVAGVQREKKQAAAK